MATSVRNLLNYLIKENYENTINKQILTRPSSKDFNSIVTFLFRKIDPSFNDGTCKFEDEVASAFKALGYPFNISKTALYAVGSPHTWPGLLAAITWLIELLNYDNAATQQPNVDLGEDVAAIERSQDRLFYDYLAVAYDAFLAADDEQYELLEEKLINELNGKTSGIDAEYQRICADNDDIVRSIEELREKSALLPELQKREEDLASDLEKFHELIAQLKEHKAALEKKVESRSSELEEQQVQLNDVTSRVQELEGRVQRQDLSAEDVERMSLERAKVEDGLEKAAAQRAEKSRALYDAKQELSGILEQLENTARSFSSKATQLKLDLEITVEVEKAAESEQALLGGVDIKGEIRPAVANAKEQATGKLNLAKAELLELLDQEEKNDEDLNEAVKTAQTLENKARRAEDAYNKEKESMDEAIEALASETDEAEQKAASLRDPLAIETAINKSNMRLAQLEALASEKKDAADARKAAILQEINKAMNSVTDQKDYIETQFAKLKGKINTQSSQFEEMKREEANRPPLPPTPL